MFATCKKKPKNKNQIKTKQKKNKTVITIYVFVNMNNFRYSLFQCLWLYVQIVNKSKLLILKKWTLIGHSKTKISTMYIKANQTQKIPKFTKYEIFPELSFRILCLIDNVSRKSILFIFLFTVTLKHIISCIRQKLNLINNQTILRNPSNTWKLIEIQKKKMISTVLKYIFMSYFIIIFFNGFLAG